MEKENKPHSYWTLELAIVEASKYKHRNEFIKNSSGCYDFCSRNNFLDIVCKDMIMKYKPKDYWTKELAIEEGKRFTTREDFKKFSSSCYNYCCKNGFLNIVCEGMITKCKNKGYWDDINNCIEEAKKYNTRTSFRNSSNVCYKHCRKNNFFDIVCKHMTERFRWTLDTAKEEASKYTTKSEFTKGSPGCYDFCFTNNFLDIVCEHMEIKGSRFLRFIYVFEFKDNHVYVGLTYNPKERYNSHLNKDNSQVYRHINKTNASFEFKVITENPISNEDAQILEYETIQKYQELGWNILNKNKTGRGSSSLGGGIRKWTEDKLKSEASLYETRVEFRKNSNSAYVTACKIEGFLNKLYPPLANNNTV